MTKTEKFLFGLLLLVSMVWFVAYKIKDEQLNGCFMRTRAITEIKNQLMDEKFFWIEKYRLDCVHPDVSRPEKGECL